MPPVEGRGDIRAVSAFVSRRRSSAWWRGFRILDRWKQIEGTTGGKYFHHVTIHTPNLGSDSVLNYCANIHCKIITTNTNHLIKHESKTTKFVTCNC